MIRKFIAMAALGLMATSLSGCIIISDNSPGPKKMQVTTIKNGSNIIKEN